MILVCHMRMGSSGVRAPVWTGSGMGHWKRLIKIVGGTDCYYCINNMTCLYCCTCYCSWAFSRYHVTCIFVTLPGTCYSFCGGILYMFCIVAILLSIYLIDINSVYAQHSIVVILHMLTCMFILHMPTCMFTSITSSLDNSIYYINWIRLDDYRQTRW